MKAKEFLENKYPVNTWENKEALFLIEQMEEYAQQKAIEFMNKRNPLTGVTYLTFNPETREPIWLSQNNDHNITIRLTTEQLYKEFNK